MIILSSVGMNLRKNTRIDMRVNEHLWSGIIHRSETGDVAGMGDITFPGEDGERVLVIFRCHQNSLYLSDAV